MLTIASPLSNIVIPFFRTDFPSRVCLYVLDVREVLMKKLTFAFVWGVLVSLVLTACGSRDESKKQNVNAGVSNRDSIKVGMTYDEVEKLLGKPFQITRGANQTTYSSSVDISLLKERGVDDIDRRLRELKFIRAVAETAKDNNVWIEEKHIETTGQLIYVNWVYSDASADTNFVWLAKSFVPKKETVFVAPQYIVNNGTVTKEEFDKVGQLVYRTYSGSWIISKGEWEAEKKEHPTEMPAPKPAKKEIRNKRVVEGSVPGEIVKKFFIVRKFYCVLFDASSGRVVQSGFQPFYVNEMK